MKYKVWIPIALIIFTLLGWYSFVNGIFTENITYKKYLEKGDVNYEKELYQEAFDNYEQALKLKKSKKVQDKIVDTYRKYYEEQDNSDAQTLYITALNRACTQFPEETSYWEEAIRVNLDASKYEAAKELCKQAEQEKIKSEELENLKQEVIYSSKYLGFSCSSYNNAVNGYFVTKTGTTYARLSSDGDEYEVFDEKEVGSIGTDGIYLCKDSENKIKFINLDGVIKGKVNLDVSEFGIYSEGFCSVKYQDNYCLIDLDGKILIDKLKYAGCFQNGKAVIQNDEGKWAMVNKKGEICSDYFEDIKVDYVGRYLFGDKVIAKQNGTYKIYNSSLTKTVSKFAAEETDIPVESGWLAFCENDKWGFVDNEGKIVVEPQYEKAKSLMYGVAAVSKDDKWGYINCENQLVVPYQFYDAGYLSGQGVCYVSDEVDYYRAMKFNFITEFIQ